MNVEILQSSILVILGTVTRSLVVATKKRLTLDMDNRGRSYTLLGKISSREQRTRTTQNTNTGVAGASRLVMNTVTLLIFTKTWVRASMSTLRSMVVARPQLTELIIIKDMREVI